MPTTIIKGTKNSEAEMFFDSKKDTLYLCLCDIFKNDSYVHSMKDLKETCDIVEISPTDSIIFLDFLPPKTITEKIKSFFNKLLPFYTA